MSAFIYRRARVRHTLVTLALALGIALPGALTPLAANPEALDPEDRMTFTLAVIPDTQIAVQNKPELFHAQTQWVVDHKTSRNIPFVIHEGDVVEWPSRISDWERAKAAMRRLDGKVPYAISPGNHDLDAWACVPVASCNPYAGIATDRSADYFNAYFPRSSFESWPSFGGTYPENTSDNSFFTFTAGRVDWLVLSLKFRPTDAELAWADRVVADHPERQIIINAHEYQNGTVRTATGDRIWNAVGRKCGNVRFIISGHYTNAGVRVDQGDHGNNVYGIQSSYQTYSVPRVNDNGYMRLMQFQPKDGTVRVRTYSPYCDQTGECPAFKTDPTNDFALTGLAFPVKRR